MSFFRLNEGCFLIMGKDSSCIYNTVTGDIIKINNDIASFINNCEKNISFDNVDKTIYEVLVQLNNINVGSFSDKPIYVEKVSVNDESKLKRFCKLNHSVKNLFIEVTNECNINCTFCNKDDATLCRKTGCKRWQLKDDRISISQIKNCIFQAKKLGCERISLMGGEPFIKFDDIKQLIIYSLELGIKNNIIFTNALILNDEMIDFLRENNVSLIIQAYSFKNDIYKEITGEDGLADILRQNLKKLNSNNINYSINILVNKFNENNIESFSNECLEFVDRNKISFDYIYPNGGNKYYSKIYYKDMFNKEKSLSRICTKQFFSNKNRHNCFGYQIALTGDGQVIPCIMSRKTVLGDINKETLVKILNKPKYIEMLKITKESIKKCNECELRYGCFDCRALEQSASGDLYGIKYCDRV